MKDLRSLHDLTMHDVKAGARERGREGESERERGKERGKERKCVCVCVCVCVCEREREREREREKEREGGTARERGRVRPRCPQWRRGAATPPRALRGLCPRTYVRTAVLEFRVSWVSNKD